MKLPVIVVLTYSLVLIVFNIPLTFAIDNSSGYSPRLSVAAEDMILQLDDAIVAQARALDPDSDVRLQIEETVEDTRRLALDDGPCDYAAASPKRPFR